MMIVIYDLDVVFDSDSLIVTVKTIHVFRAEDDRIKAIDGVGEIEIPTSVRRGHHDGRNNGHVRTKNLTHACRYNLISKCVIVEWGDGMRLIRTPDCL